MIYVMVCECQFHKESKKNLTFISYNNINSSSVSVQFASNRGRMTEALFLSKMFTSLKNQSQEPDEVTINRKCALTSYIICFL